MPNLPKDPAPLPPLPPPPEPSSVVPRPVPSPSTVPPPPVQTPSETPLGSVETANDPPPRASVPAAARRVHRKTGLMQWLPSDSPNVAAAAEWKYELDTVWSKAHAHPIMLPAVGVIPFSARVLCMLKQISVLLVGNSVKHVAIQLKYANCAAFGNVIFFL